MTIDDLIRDFLKKQDDARPTLVWVAFKNHRLVAFAVTWVVVVTGGQVAWEPVFVMPRPKSHYRTGRNAHLLRDSAPTAPAGKPDVDKLSRAVLDAISSTKTVWGDDAQVTDLHAIKRYTELGEKPGCHIHIREVAR